MKLKTILLPAGDVPGIDINYPAGTGRTKYDADSWLGEGFDGVLFKGRGKNKTHLRGIGDAAVLVDQHHGIVAFEDLTIHSGKRQGIFFGLEHHDGSIDPKFHLSTNRVRLVADQPSVWGIFAYEASYSLTRTTFDLELAAEHIIYGHQLGPKGGFIYLCRFNGSGSQQVKTRSSPEEVDDLPGPTKLRIQRSLFSNWHRPNTWRGDGAIVCEGMGDHVDLEIDQCEFWAGGNIGNIPAHQRTRCVMIDDAKGAYWGTAYATGHVSIRRSLFRAGPGNENLSTLIRCGNLADGPHFTAKSFTLEQCGLWGEKLQIQLSTLAPGTVKIDACNTPRLRQYADARGIDTSYEALIPLHDRVIPASEGFAS